MRTAYLETRIEYLEMRLAHLRALWLNGPAELFEKIRHGSEEHQEWLKNQLKSWFEKKDADS